MSNVVKFSDVSDKIITVRDTKVIVDSDVAQLYGVETKEINQAVKNNPRKFPEGYIIETSKDEKNELVKNFDRFNKLKHSTVCPAAFTKKGCYMLATILKGEKATDTTIEIIEAFDKLNELKETVVELSQTKDEANQKALMQKGGEIISEIIGNELETSDTETSIEINFAILKFKHTIKKSKNN